MQGDLKNTSELKL